MKHSNRLKLMRQAGIYLVTSQPQSAGRSTLAIVKQALAGGIRLIQLREKEMATADFTRLALKVRKLTTDAGALLIINDRLDIALAVDADGVHLGQDDLPVASARRIAPEMLIGCSTHSVPEARRAERDGASYINIGPLFPTRTKQWDKPFLGLIGLKRIAAVTSLPFTVMGGIKKEHIPDLHRAGAQIIALVSAITAAPDPSRAARDLLYTSNSTKNRKE